LEKAFAAAEQEEYRPGESKKEREESEPKESEDSKRESTKTKK
jgi:hypothetical protein